MRRVAALSLLLTAGLLVAAAQNPSAPVFRVRTELVLLPVKVNKGRRHLGDLRAENFRVRLNGKNVPVAVFEEIRPVAGRGAGAVTHAGSAPPALTQQQSPSTAPEVVILLLDYLNSGRWVDIDDFADRYAGFQAALAFVEEHVRRSERPLAFYALGRKGLYRVFAADEDRNAIVAAAQHLQAGSPETPPHADAARIYRRLSHVHDMAREDVSVYKREAEEIRQWKMFNALRQIAEDHRGVSGRKPLIWFTSAAPPSAPTGPVASSDSSEPTDLNEGLDAASLRRTREEADRMLAAAMIAAYPVDVRGLVVVGSDVRNSAPTVAEIRRRSTARLDAERFWLNRSIDFMKNSADTTGGRAFYGRNDLAAAAHEAVADSGEYYLLGFYAPKDTLQPGWQRLSVQVRGRKGIAQVRYREGFYIGREEDDPSAGLRLAMASPVDLPGIPLEARLEPVEASPPASGGGESRRQVTVLLNIPPRGLTLRSEDSTVAVECVVAAKGATGAWRILGQRRLDVKPETAEAQSKLERGGVNYSATVELAHDDRAVRLIVRDLLSGRIGSISLPLP